MHRKMSKKLCIIYTIIITAAILQFSGCSKGKEGYGEELVEIGAVEIPDEEAEEKEEQKEKETQKEKEAQKEIEELQEFAQEGDGGNGTDEPGGICVHVCGRVVNPGVYMLSSGSRIYEAVEAAGGLCEDAAGECLNQASQMEDGQQIYVPSREEAAQGTVSAQKAEGNPRHTTSSDSTKTEEGKVNLNTASEEQLMTLSGIGEAKAAAIIRYREEHGGFQKIEELKEVEGIKEGVFNKVKDQVRI